MRLFGRKNEDEDEEFEEESGNKRTVRLDKDKERKERKPKENKSEIKPWTKRERFFVLGVFLFTVITSALLGMNAREWKLPNLPRLALPQILSEETIVIEGSETGSSEREIITAFEDMTKPLSGVYGFFVMELGTGTFFGVNDKETFEAASLNKLPVMLTMYREAEEGNINLSTKYVLKNEDRSTGSGSLGSKPVGTSVTYEELVQLMGKESDNTAYNISRKLLGEEKILGTMKVYGFAPTLLSENEATPDEIGFFFKKLLDAKVDSRETRDALLEFMTDTIYENWIAKDIPVQVAHKYGTLSHVRNDAGIVMATKPYILVVMSKGIVESEADVVIPQFSRKVYDLLQTSK